MTISEMLAELVGFHAYQTGCRDSGVHNPDREKFLKNELAKLMESREFRAEEAKWFREYWLSDESIAQGYGMEDAHGFYDWLTGR